MNNNHSRTSVFLIEFTISLLLFSLATAVCVQFFVRAHLKSKDSEYLTHAVIETQNVAEIFRSNSTGKTDETIAALQKQYPELEKQGALELTIYYNSKFKHCPKSDKHFMTTIIFSRDNDFLSADIRFWDTMDDKEIYSLPIKLYIGGQE